MKLIGTRCCPYVRKTRIVLLEKKIDHDFLIVEARDLDGELVRLNPLAQVPVLVLDDGNTLYDSRVIVEYLDNMTPNNRLIPASGRERLAVKRWEALGDGLCDAATALQPENLPDDGQIGPIWQMRQQQRIERTLAVMAGELGEAPWCFGTGMTLSDVALGCALGYLDCRFAGYDWRSHHAALARHFDKLSARPSFAETWFAA